MPTDNVSVYQAAGKQACRLPPHSCGLLVLERGPMQRDIRSLTAGTVLLESCTKGALQDASRLSNTTTNKEL